MRCTAMVPAALVALVCHVQASGAQSSDRVHAVVREAQGAVESGQERAFRSRWGEQRVAPEDRSLAQLVAATIDRVAYRSTAAESLYRTLADDSVRAPVIAAHASAGLAALAGQSFRLDQAVVNFERAFTRFAALRDSTGQADALAGLAFTLLRTQGVEAARRRVRQSQALTPARDRWLRARVACTSIAIRVRARDAIDDTEWQQLRRQSEDGGARTVAQCLLARAQALDARGQSDSALVVLDSLATIQRSARIWSGLSATRQWEGYLLSTLGDFGEARAALTDAIAMGAASGSLSSAGWANLNLASLSQRIGAWGDAARYARIATGALREAQDETGLLFARRASAEGALLRGDLARADREFAALAKDNDVLAPQTVAIDLITRADIARRQRREADAVRLLDSAQRIAARRDMPGWRTELAYQRALLDLAASRFASASRQLRQLVDGDATLTTPARFELFSRIAEAEAESGNLDEAETQMRLAMARSDAWRGGLTHRDLVLTALQSHHIDWEPDPGFAAVVGALSRGGRHETAMEFAEWRRARWLQREALKRSALATPEVAAPSPDAARSPSRESSMVGTPPAGAPGEQTKRDRPSRGTAIVSYLSSADGAQLTAFVRTSDTLVSVRLATLPGLPDLIGRFVGFLQVGRVPRPAARRLAVELIDPLLPLLPREVRRLVLVPDGALHRLPFSALLLADSSYLAQKFELATAPSVAIATRGLVRARAHEGADRRGVLAVGAPDRLPLNEDGSKRWEPLPGARLELRLVERLVLGSMTLTGRMATVPGFREAVRRGGPVLHIATHADADDESLAESGLAFEPTAADDGVLRAPALAAMSLPFDLVVLSSCESAEGLLVSGEGLQGLSSAVLDAGSRAVIATRWRLEDASMVNFVGSLYERLAIDGDAVVALAEVRRAAIARGESPALWANIEFVGDPNVRVTLESASLRTPLRIYVTAILGLALVGLAGYSALRFRNRRSALRR